MNLPQLPQIATVIPPAMEKLYSASFLLALFAFICVLPLIVSDIQGRYASYLKQRTLTGRVLLALGVQSLSHSLYLLASYLVLVWYRLPNIYTHKPYEDIMSLTIVPFAFLRIISVLIGLTFVFSFVPLISLIIYIVTHINFRKIPLRYYAWSFGTVVLFNVLFNIAVFMNMYLRGAPPPPPTPIFGYGYYGLNILYASSFAYLAYIIFQTSSLKQTVLKILFIMSITAAICIALFPIIIEQNVFRGKVCFGISCPLSRGIEMRWKQPPESGKTKQQL